MAESKRTERIALSLYPSEDDQMEKMAEEMGLPVAIYARMKALEGMRQDLAQLDADRDAQRRPQAA